MIQSIADKETKKIWNNTFSKKLPQNIQAIALSKLLLIHAATTLQFLETPPGNQLKRLKGERKSQHSIRINKQWRICFEWINNHAENVEICDDH